MADTFKPYAPGKSGGSLSRPDARDHEYSSELIGAAIKPFDWQEGFDIEQKLGRALPSKDQGVSLSCGGQMISYYVEVLEALETGTFEPRSAKHPYSQIYVPPSGGAFMRDVFTLPIKQGIAEERLCPSYENGQAPSEAFMRRNQDITPQARENAAIFKSTGYANVNPMDIDAVAQAIRDNNGVGILFRATNNGTWLSPNPVPPETPAAATWGHFTYEGKALLVNGVKRIFLKQSWGDKAGIKGWQSFGEEWFANGHVLECRTLYRKPGFKHTFAVNLTYRMENPEVKALQQALKEYGTYSYATATGYYGNITADAVMQFQIKAGVLSPQEAHELKGWNVGPKTRAKLNELYGS